MICNPGDADEIAYMNKCWLSHLIPDQSEKSLTHGHETEL